MARRCSTICLPASKEAYLACIDSPAAFRRWLDAALRRHPELFPKAFAHGYLLKDSRFSAKANPWRASRWTDRLTWARLT